MGKSKKTKDYRKDPVPKQASIHFEIEENALELMEEHLALFKPKAKSADTPTQAPYAKRVVSKVLEIDLHGLNLEDAERTLMDFIDSHCHGNDEKTFKIITGKGKHSEAGRGVLVREIYLFVKHRYGPRIVKIEESPDAVRIGGQALRGHFHVTLKG